jgi:hypothetical protein
VAPTEKKSSRPRRVPTHPADEPTRARTEFGATSSPRNPVGVMEASAHANGLTVARPRCDLPVGAGDARQRPAMAG